MPSLDISYGPRAWKLLDGVFCVYKSAFKGYGSLRNTIASRLSIEMNEMDVRPPKKRVLIEGQLSDGKGLSVVRRSSYADHPLVVGPRYQEKDFRIFWVNNIGYNASGLMVGGIGSKGCYKAHVLREGNFVRVYEMSCKFGIATDTYMTDGKVVEKATTRHVSRERLDRVLTKIESSQRLQMFNSAGIDMNTEAGYQLAAGGLFRPSQKLTMPIIYALKCTKFSHPEFTVEVHVINENPMYLLELVNGIGLSMRSVACVSKMRCTRYGNFTVEQALLRKHWSVEHIINNIQMCEPLTRDNVLKPSSPHLSSPSDDGQTRESFLEMLKREENVAQIKSNHNVADTDFDSNK